MALEELRKNNSKEREKKKKKLYCSTFSDISEIAKLH